MARFPAQLLARPRVAHQHRHAEGVQPLGLRRHERQRGAGRGELDRGARHRDAQPAELAREVGGAQLARAGEVVDARLARAPHRRDQRRGDVVVVHELEPRPRVGQDRHGARAGPATGSPRPWPARPARRRCRAGRRRCRAASRPRPRTASPPARPSGPSSSGASLPRAGTSSVSGCGLSSMEAVGGDRRGVDEPRARGEAAAASNTLREPSRLTRGSPRGRP